MGDAAPVLSSQRLNGEPVIFRGCGSSELLMILVGAAAVLYPVTVGIAGFFGAFAMGIGLATVLLVGVVVILATWFQRIKRGRPHGHYQQMVRLWLEDKGFGRSRMLRHDGDWDVGRRSGNPV